MAPEIIKLTNCRLAINGTLVQRDLYISPTTGLIVDAQAAFFSTGAQPTAVYDLSNRIVSPGFLEVQLNGGWGFDFSVPSPTYAASLRSLNRSLVRTGVTSYTPTLTSQKPAVYRSVVPHLAATAPARRVPADGAEVLGPHLEGPFIHRDRNGIHKREVLQVPTWDAVRATYGAENLDVDPATGASRTAYVTLAPELDPSGEVVRQLRARGIVVSAGHSTATHEDMLRVVGDGGKGVGMVTHLYNAMNQPHHRETGIVGAVLGETDHGGKKEAKGYKRPFFGIIADNIHVHPSMVRVAYQAHPEGCILVTDAMMLLGCPDGEYEWTNGERIVKKGALLTLKGTNGKIAGSSATLVECIQNLVNWAEIPVEKALETVTSTPAKMLGVQDRKGTLKVGADADLVVLDEHVGADGKVVLSIDEVWKFGVKVHESKPVEAATARALL